MKYGLIFAISFGLASSTVIAGDARLVSHLYNPNEVVRIEGQAGVQTSIAFGEDEHIENVAIGDSTTWQVTPNKRANMLFIKPLSTRARTNLTVVTDQHKYFFDLVARSDARPLYVLQFVYPEKPKPLPAPIAAKSLTPDEALLASGDLGSRPTDPARVNAAWHKKGDAPLFPSRIYDDGASTFLSWPQKASIPAILVRNERGDEGPVNFAVLDDVTIIDGVPSTIILRSGKEMAVLENRGPVRKSEDQKELPASQTLSTKGGR